MVHVGVQRSSGGVIAQKENHGITTAKSRHHVTGTGISGDQGNTSVKIGDLIIKIITVTV
jgi:hypothetical protein